MTVMALHSAFLRFLLSEEVLVLRCVVVIREYLGEKHVHIVCLPLLSWTVCEPDWSNWCGNGHSCRFVRNLLFHALVTEVKHLASEGLCHEGLTWSASWL